MAPPWYRLLDAIEMKLVTTISFILFLFMQAQLWFGTGGVIELLRLKQTVAQQLSENNQLLARNSVLAAELSDLKLGMAAVEERARNELGMIRQDEVFYQIIH